MLARRKSILAASAQTGAWHAQIPVCNRVRGFVYDVETGRLNEVT